MPFLSQETIEEVNISGYALDNSKLNKLGKIRISPLKSFAILLFAIAFLLPKAVSAIPDLSLYFDKFSAAKELAWAAEVSEPEKENYSIDGEQKKIEEPKQKKLTLADIWPEEAEKEKSAPNIIPAVLLKVAADQPQKQTPADIWPEVTNKEVAMPRRLVIPAIKVSANIESAGIGQGGAMEAPKNYQEVGWFNLGPRPGEPGIAIIAGHLNNEYGAAGIFWHLSKIKEGDDIYVADASGKTFHFKVSGNKIYSADSFLEEIFERGGGARLNLITCNGAWDKNAQNYTKRLVVSAKLLVE